MPIEVRAENERQAFIDGTYSGSANTIQVHNCSYWNFVGLYASNGDQPGTYDGGGVMTVADSSSITVRRSVFSHPNRYQNSHLILLWRTYNSLVEENEGYYYHRHGFVVYYGSGNTFRRNYLNARGHWDLWDGFGPTDPPWNGDAGIIIYPGSYNLVENNIVENSGTGFHVEASAPSDGNLFFGNISISTRNGVVVRTRDAVVTNTTIRDQVVLNPASTGIFLRGAENTQVLNSSVFGSTNDGYLCDDQSAGYIWSTQPSCYITNSLSHSNTWFGMRQIGQRSFGFNYTASIGNWMNYVPSAADAAVTNEFTQTTALVGNKIWIPENSTLKGAGQNGSDIGANVLYRSVNGALTGELIWDRYSGAFPCGALVGGLNDWSGWSCFDVHIRLNISSNTLP
jgi:parallel beta-helix repeat protein